VPLVEQELHNEGLTKYTYIYGKCKINLHSLQEKFKDSKEKIRSQRKTDKSMAKEQTDKQ
jgi:hypothetical protein